MIDKECTSPNTMYAHEASTAMNAENQIVFAYQ